jgi:hypothetical protein
VKRLRSIELILGLAFTMTGCGGNFQASPPASLPIASSTAQEQTAPLDRRDYAQVLQTYVNDRGLVDYRKLQANRGQLDRYVKSLGQVPASTYANWSDPEKIAFLINAYNAFTLQSIIDQKPIKASIRDIPGVWKWRKFAIAGQNKTLDNIEHDILRKAFNEPRIHAALVCAAKSCPLLRREPYQGDHLDAQLDEQVQQFLASPHGLKIDRQAKKVYLSSIFDWFGEDWKPSYGAKSGFAGNENQRSVLNFVSQYLNPSDRTYLKQGNYTIGYLNYDWSLNQQ